MSDNSKAEVLQETEILKRNKKVDARVVNAQIKLELQLEVLGVEVKPKFNVEPPLGRGRARLYSQNF